MVVAVGATTLTVAKEATESFKAQKVRTLREAGHNVDLTNPRTEWKFDIPPPYK